MLSIFRKPRLTDESETRYRYNLDTIIKLYQHGGNDSIARKARRHCYNDLTLIGHPISWDYEQDMPEEDVIYVNENGERRPLKRS